MPTGDLKETKQIEMILQNNSFKNVLNNKFNCYIKQHIMLLEVCKKLEDTFSLFMLIKIFISRLNIIADILCVFYVIIQKNINIVSFNKNIFRVVI